MTGKSASTKEFSVFGWAREGMGEQNHTFLINAGNQDGEFSTMQTDSVV